MLKKYSSLLITMIIIFSMSMTAFADITITTDIKTDSSDNSYTFMVNASDTDNGTLTYQWYECDASGGNPALLSGATGNVYQPTVDKETKYYYCEVTSVSESGTVKSNSKVLEAAYSGESAKTKEIYTISVEGITAPATGETPASKATSTSAGVKITSISWDPKNSAFQPETIYTATVNVTLDENCEAGSGLKCLIDGNEAVISGDPSSGSFSFYYTFPATDAAAAEDEDADGENGTVTDMMKDLPSPLGIPGWIWVLIIIVLIIALIAAAVAHSKAKKRERSRHNYMDEIYQEKQAKKKAEEMCRKKAEPIYDEDESDDAEYDEYDEDAESEYSEDDCEEDDVTVYEKKKDRKASRQPVSRADDNNVSFYVAEDEGFTGEIKTADPEESESDADVDNENTNDKELPDA